MHLLGEAPKIVRWNRLRARPRLGAPPQTPSPQTFPAGGALRGGMRVDCWRREDGESGEPLSTEALSKGLSEPWREALAKIFSVRNVATPVESGLSGIARVRTRATPHPTLVGARTQPRTTPHPRPRALWDVRTRARLPPLGCSPPLLGSPLPSPLIPSPPPLLSLPLLPMCSHRCYRRCCLLHSARSL